MGVIEKSIRKRGNQKLAAPIFTNTTKSREEVTATVKRLCERLTAENVARVNEARAGGFWKSARVAAVKDGHVTYYVEVDGARVLIGYFAPPKNILALSPKAKLKSNQAYWLAEVAFMKPTPQVPAGHTVVRLTLLRWVTDQNGRLRNRDKYELLADRLHAAISIDAR